MNISNFCSCLLMAAAVSACSSSGSSSSMQEVGQGVISEETYRKHVATLSSDEFGGRAPASPGEQLTVEYLVDAFKSMGLSPGNGDSFVQDVPLVSVEVTNAPDLVISSGKGRSFSFAFGHDQVVFSRQQVSGAGLNNSELVFVGYGINAPERGWNDYADVDVTGKTVVMLINDPGYATQDPDMFNGNAMTYYGRWDYKFDEAAKQGAVGAIIIHDTKPAAYPWTTVENSWTGPQFDIVRQDKGVGLASVESWITREVAEVVFEAAGLDLDEMYRQAKTPGFAARPMGLSASVNLEMKKESVVSRNVIAQLKGREAPEEIVLYMAHWDHLGTDASLEGDGIFNGALDNATGTAGLLELAAAFASMPEPPRRSVVFLAVTAEEQGLLGSLHYAANPVFPLASTVAGLNMDGLNKFGRTRDVTVIGYGLSELDDILASAAGTQNRVLAADREAEKGYYYRSDHFELAKLGVPMLYPNNGYDHVEYGVGYGMEQSASYIGNDYHGVTDEYSEDWDVAGAIEDLQLYFLFGEAIANTRDWPTWKAGSEFKAERDRQLGLKGASQ